MLAVSRSFISRVAAGQRALTIEHLATLERALGKPTALLLLEGAGDPSDAAHLAKERARIRALLRRPVSADDDTPLTPQELREVDKLSKDIDGRLSLLSRRVGSSAKAPRVSESQIVNLLRREAGLSCAAARRAYRVQARFAAASGLLLFSR